MTTRIGFLSFGHWQPIPGSQVRTARDALVQSVELAVAAEELGLDGTFVRVRVGRIRVNDIPRRRVVQIPAPRTYLARS